MQAQQLGQEINSSRNDCADAVDLPSSGMKKPRRRRGVKLGVERGSRSVDGRLPRNDSHTGATSQERWRALPVASAAALVTVSAAIALAFLAPLFLIDAGTAEALAIAYLAAFATIPAAIAFAFLAEPALVVTFVAKIGAVVA
jgi:hypothetical protein